MANEATSKVATTPSTENGSGHPKLMTAAETEVYDRQIRLWGIEAQHRLRHSKVLVVGLKGLGAEVVKNLLLCGLNELQLIDEDMVSEEDLSSNFFLQAEHVGKMSRALASFPGAGALNPHVKLTRAEDIDKVNVSAYSMVILCDQPYPTVIRVNENCRKQNVKFIACVVYGWIGYAFFDFNGHHFLIKKQKESEFVDLDRPSEDLDRPSEVTVDEFTTIDEDEFKIERVPYSSFELSLNVDWQAKKLVRKARALLPSAYFPIRALMRLEEARGPVAAKATKPESEELRVLIEQWKKELEIGNQTEEGQSPNEESMQFVLGAQLNAACATVGGFVGQEAIKALTEGKNPLKNLLIYSALENCGRMCNLPPT